MNTLKKVIAACWDHLLAPACVFDTASSGYCQLGSDSDAEEAGGSGFSWQQDYGNNTDGTPMLDSCVDVMGKPYGS